jgi:polysaccharide biosynthesis protein PslH
MLNVLSIVSYNFLPAKMGGQSGIALFNNFLAKHCNLYCLTIQSNDATFAEGYTVLPILSNSKTRYVNIFLLFPIIKIIQQKKISHIIFEHPYYGWLAFLIKLFCNVKIVIHSHNIEAQRFKSLQKKWWLLLSIYEKYTHKLADFNFFIHDDDKQFAIKNYNLSANKCTTITYGFKLSQAPSQDEKNKAKQFIVNKFSIAPTDVILLFNGTLDYLPNLAALDTILQNINPILLTNSTNKFAYKIIICGKNLPSSYNNLEAYKNKNIVFAGFVDDISVYFKASDIFLNPVTDGGGIKTKIVEALGYNVALVTTKSGSIGISDTITGNKMVVVGNNNWQQFTQAIIDMPLQHQIPESYFQHFYWDNIAKKAINFIT